MKLAIFKEILEIKSGKKELREFGVTMGTVLAILFLFFLWKGKPNTFIFLGLSVFFYLFGMAVPVWLKPIQKVWMAIAVVMGWMMSRVILSVLFYLVLTPIGVCARLFGENFLDLKMNAGKQSYWINREKKEFQKSDYEKQF